MRVTKGIVSLISDIIIDSDLDMLTLYQVKRLAAPASGEALRKGNKDIANAEVADAAAIALSKTALDLTDHKARHESGGADEVDATGLVGAGEADFGAGDVLIGSNDTTVEPDNSLTDYTKVREMFIGKGGTLRIKFDMRTENAAAMVYGRIYRNGAAAGTEQTSESETYATKSEDIAGWSPGDLVQLYVKTSSGAVGIHRKNFRIYTDKYSFCYFTLEE